MRSDPASSLVYFGPNWQMDRSVYMRSRFGALFSQAPFLTSPFVSLGKKRNDPS
jgi:hypothetical protein